MTFPPVQTEQRTLAVQKAIESWVRKLVDFSQRNNLLYFRDLKAGTLNLDDAEPAHFDRLLAGEAVALSRLRPGETPEANERTARSMLGIWRRALANHEERGLQTLFLAHGMATWNDMRAPTREGVQPRPLLSPILLYPIAVERAGREGQGFNLRLAGEPQINLVLLLAMKEWAGLTIDPEALLQVPAAEDFRPELAYQRLFDAARQLPGFAIVDRTVLGNFAFQKMALVADLLAHPDIFAGHDLVAAIAGSAEARVSLSGRTGPEEQLPEALDPQDDAFDAVDEFDAPAIGEPGDFEPGARLPEPVSAPTLPGERPNSPAEVDLDSIDPSDEFLVLDADSSQQRVILRALAGQHGVIQGPPGTGKSQSIVNLIASFAAEGKRVLFVAEKRAALEVVLNRLQNLGLGHLALDLHGADVSRKAVMARIADAFEAVRDSVAPPDQEIHETFVQRRAALVAHADRMNRPGPGGVTLHSVFGALLDLPPGLTSETRWRGAALEALSGPPSRRVTELLTEASTIALLFARTPGAAWSAFAFPDGHAALAAMDVVHTLRSKDLPGADQALDYFVAACGLSPTDDLAVMRERVQAANAWLGVSADYGDALYDADMPLLVAKLAPASASGIGGFFKRLGGGYRSTRKQVEGLRRTPAPPAQMHMEMMNAVATRDRWRRTGASVPPAKGPAEAAQHATQQLDASLGALAATSREPLVLPPSIVDLADWLDALHIQRSDAPRAARAVELRDAIAAAGAGDFLDEVERGVAVPATWAMHFQHAYLTSMLDQARTLDSTLAGFDGRYFDELVDEFCDLDRQRLEIAAQRVRRAHAERAIAAMNRFPEQESLVRRESQKKTRHLPLRTLVARAPDVLTALSPCWMASPLSVSQLLDIERRTFDVVIFDEASQVLPEDAVCSLVRAEYAIVAGDSRQLPPTTFFAAGVEDGEIDDEDEVGGFESLLDQMMALVPEPWLLEWHYRSRDERLIAYSNREIYNNRLVTFPGARPDSPVRHFLVDTANDANEESSNAEVTRVVELIFEHVENQPGQSLGVIALGIKHAQRLQDAFDRELLRRGADMTFFGETQAEPFFIKNLERVQGDERDAIILSVGYGKDASGKLPLRFGPILQQGGERRLNVAITRARSSMTLVSSFSHLEMDPEKCEGRRGLELLRGYLEYASTLQANPIGRGGGLPGGVERAIADALEQQGLQLVPRLGSSTYRVDVAVREPGDDGAFALAIETDGPSYASGATARDRDRLRPQQLERLGWRFHRVWTPDWARNEAAETARIMDALREIEPPALPVVRPVAEAMPLESPPPAIQGFAAFEPGDEFEAEVEGESEPTIEAPADERAPRPRIARRQSVDQYSLRELVMLVEWIQSDGRLRTDEELLDAMVGELGFSRRGSRIERAVRQAIAVSRPPGG